MPLSLYDSTVAVFVRQLKTLSALLRKGEEWCDDNGKLHSELLEARLAPDMYPLTSQVRLSVRWARNGVLLNAGYSFVASDGRPAIKHTFAELHGLIQEALEFLQSVKAEDIEGAENRPLSVWSSGEEGKGWNIEFDAGHKMKGVPLGKADFLMGGGPFDE